MNRLACFVSGLACGSLCGFIAALIVVLVLLGSAAYYAYRWPDKRKPMTTDYSEEDTSL